MTLFDTEYRRLDAVKYEMSGYYQCIISNTRVNMTERRFISNRIHLVVIPPPTMWEIVSRSFDDTQCILYTEMI